MEILGIGAMGVGMLIALIGWIWLIVIGFQKGGALWGILNILCQPITGLIFCIMHKTGWLQLALIIIGNIIAGVGMIPLMPAYIKALEQMQNMPR
jgi:hypothetical protein